MLAPDVVTGPLERTLAAGGVEAVLAAGPLPMVRAVAAACAAASVPCQVALEAPMACGFGACYGCAVELDGRVAAALHRGSRGGGGAHRMSASLGGLELAHPVLNGSGTLDALAAFDVLGDATLGCAAHVTKTITPEPRPGNPPPRIAEVPAGLVNSIGLPGPGVAAFRAEVLPATGGARATCR